MENLLLLDYIYMPGVPGIIIVAVYVTTNNGLNTIPPGIYYVLKVYSKYPPLSLPRDKTPPSVKSNRAVVVVEGEILTTTMD